MSTTQRFRIYTLDYWDYREPTTHVFNNKEEAEEMVCRLQTLSDKTIMDPTVCYFVQEEKE